MSNRRRSWVLGVGAVLLLPGAAAAATKGSSARLVAATVEAGNSFYRVSVDNNPASGELGVYTARTGPDHPAGPNLDVLFGGGLPGTTFNTVRSFTANTDYVQSELKTSSNPIVLLSPFGALANIGTTGFRATYTLPGPPTTPDALTIVQDVNVLGTTFVNSTVEVTTSVTNNGATAVAVGIRYLWDFEIGEDDGPTFLQRQPFGAVLVDETQFVLPSFESYRIQDNDENPNPPTFDVFGTVTGPGSVTPPPTAPGVLQFASWPNSSLTAFDYAVNPLTNIADAAEGLNDSAVLYYFGRDTQSALTIAPGATVTVSASLFLRLPVGAAAGVPAMPLTGLGALAVALVTAGVVVVRRRMR